jgi:hypothetical protein
VEGVDVPVRRVVALLDDLQRLLVARRDQGAAGLALVEELVLGHLLRLGMVGDEDDLDRLVLGAEELVERKKKLRARYFFSRSMDPDVSMTQITTALLSSRSSITRRL